MSSAPSPQLHPVFSELRRRSGELTALLRALVQCHPLYGSPGQARAQALLMRELQSVGFEVSAPRIDKRALARSAHFVDVSSFGGAFHDYLDVDAQNAVASRCFASHGPKIVLNGHVDVEFVTAPQGWRHPGLWCSGEVLDGKVYGRGTSDMLGGLACYVHTLKCLSPFFDECARGSLQVQCVVDEEIGGNGTLWELLSGRCQSTDLAIIAEPTELSVYGRSRGFSQLKVVCRGSPVHMVFAREHDNAVRTVADVIYELEQLNSWICQAAGSSPSSRYVMYGQLGGGTDAAVPAERAEVFVTLALPAGMATGDVVARLSHQLASLERDGRPAPRIEPHGISFGGSRLTHPHACRILRSLCASSGMTAEGEEFPSACDARLFETFGIPSLVFGPGSLRRAHGSDEFVSTAELQLYCDVLAGALLRFWREGVAGA